ncbi:GT2 family glycosyltransferase [Variovorax paradoxus]|uniref:glycosyltransferase n=1 Tax=Variovorax paradoxus TaxID=34073 RepID=UPI00339B00EA
MQLTTHLPDWLRRVLRLCRWILMEPSGAPGSARASGAHSESAESIEALVIRIYELALHRTPSLDERVHWTNAVVRGQMSVAGLVNAVSTSPEAKQLGAPGRLLPDVPNGKLIQFAYDSILGRGAMAAEIANWDHRISQQHLGRDVILTSLFIQRANEVLGKQGPVFNPDVCDVMGTGKLINVKDWQKRADAIAEPVEEIKIKAYRSLAFPRNSNEILVSAVASLYRGGDYIEQFMENITSQTIFSACCELIIIDADSPENEYEVISSYMKRFPNIVYHRASTRIGIYEAWNLGVKMARGKYITNTNLDDLRRHDSFERQVEILEKFPFVDVAYQDFYYSFDGKASIAKTAAVGVKSDVPVVTPYNLMRSNSPHNAPMWRRSIHDDVGFFDASYRSAGDYDFWLRCVGAGKVFYKINDPHVVYFVNPEGLSTQPNTRGHEEGKQVTQLHGRTLISPRLLCSDEDFLAEASRAVGASIEVSESERGTEDWRYAASQRAMRLCSIASRKNTPAKK